MATDTHANWYKDLPEPAKRMVHALAIFLLLGLTAGAFAFTYSYALSARIAAHTQYSPRQINVSGEGAVALRPDTAVFTTSIVAQAKKVGDAQRENSARSRAVTSFLKSQSIADKDIRTVSYAVTPQYSYPSLRPCVQGICPPQQPPTISSYEVRHTVEIKIRDLEKTDGLLDGVVSAGANEVGQITFKVDDENKAKAEARTKAIADAKVKAARIARDLGVRLVRISGFYEQDGNIPPIPYEGAVGRVLLKTEAGPGAELGEQEIKSSVTITYEFR